LSRRSVQALALSTLPLMACSGMVYSILPVYFTRGLGASATEVGIVFTAGAAAGALASPQAGRLSDRVGRKSVLLASMAGFTAAFALYALISTAAQAALIQLLEGAAWAMFGSAASAYVADVADVSERGWAMGVYQRVHYIGWAVGPVLGGYLADAIGFKVVLLLGASLTAVGLAALAASIKEAAPSLSLKASSANPQATEAGRG